MRSIPPEAWGVVLILVAVLAGLGIYSDLAGPAGRAVRAGSADLVGLDRVLLPVVFAVAGAGLLWHRHPPDRDDIEMRLRVGFVRLASGSVLLVAATCGLLDLAGTPRHLAVGAVLPMARAAGGLVGAGVGMPLRAALSGPGAATVLVAAGLLALLAVTGTSLRTASRWVVSGARLLARVAGGATRRLRDFAAALDLDDEPVQG
ncbi:MAG: DNA translocase FtsK 4TM domain-containing protein, partial [Actinomycetota bacterium]|nr:DNA translocase FtsK 4TM domain-containing protein [Actinomycetota bacterium]